jgi:hypothetical protein
MIKSMRIGDSNFLVCSYLVLFALQRLVEIVLLTDLMYILSVGI